MLSGVSRSLVLSAWVSVASVCSPAFAQPPTSSPLPPLPGLGVAGAAAATADRQSTFSSALSPQQLYEHIRRGVVAVERNGVPLALGTVLDGDGRILTSLSGVGGLETADVRYADGIVVHAKIGSGDKASDLALLVPQSSKRTEGLAASESDPLGTMLRAMLPTRGTRLGPAEAGVKGRAEAHARDGAPLTPMLDVDVKGPVVVGAPLLDAMGGVVAVLVKACKGAAAPAPSDRMPWAAWGTGQEGPPKPASAPCTPVVVGAPVSTIRSFLAGVPGDGSATIAPPGTSPGASPAPWLGIRGESASKGGVHGVRVVAIAPSSPAQRAGLKPDADIVVAADGRPIDTPETLGETIAKHAPGDAVKLLVFGDDKFREVLVVLRQAP
jgi:S1-C subfamily serine protease